MPVSPRLRDCVLSYQEALADFKKKAEKLQQLEEICAVARRLLFNKADELRKERRTCFGLDWSDTDGYARPSVIQLEGKTYLIVDDERDPGYRMIQEITIHK